MDKQDLSGNSLNSVIHFKRCTLTCDNCVFCVFGFSLNGFSQII